MKQGAGQTEPELGDFGPSEHSSNTRKEDEDDHGRYVMQARRAAQVGDIESLKLLLDNNLITATSTDSDDCSLLHWAAINNRLEVNY